MFTVGLVVSSSTLAGGTVSIKKDAEPKLVNADAGHGIDLSDRLRQRADRSAPRAPQATASLSPDFGLKAEEAAQASRENVERRIAQEKVAKAKAEAARKQAEARKRAAERAARAAARKRAAQAALARSYRLPVSNYRLTASYGQSGSRWSSGYHTGLDFAASTGTPVRAVHSGTIIDAAYSGAYGNRLKLRLDNGTVLYYCHLSGFARTGGSVSAGEVIGYVGATGNVTGPHLHFEVRPGGGDPIDPYAWLRDKGLTP